jgi:quinoprotein glucose dehydrogenase
MVRLTHPALGWNRRVSIQPPGALSSPDALFLGGVSDPVIGRLEGRGWGKKFRAYDKATGKVIWEIELPSGTTGGPMTYMLRGKQYIVVPIGAQDHPPEYVALALP